MNTGETSTMAHTGTSEYPTGNPAYPTAPTGYPAQTPPGYAYSNHLQTVLQQPIQTVIVRQPQQAAPSDYLAFAIIVTFCCCLPFGIVGIIKASEAKNRFASGDYDGAEESSESAKNWSIAGLVTGCIKLTLVIILNFVLAASAVNEADEYYN